jgi:hypothetical protein
MMEMNPGYAILSIFIMISIYAVITNIHKNRSGMETIFQAALFQLSRKLQVYMQKSRKIRQNWRPSAICISEDSFEREKAFDFLNWISHKHGFGTYLHLIRGYYSKSSFEASKSILNDLIAKSSRIRGNMYIDTIISPSYTSAIAQVLQVPSPSGMENNMIIFEYDKKKPENLNQIIENLAMAEAGDFDICILGSSRRNTLTGSGIHVWIRNLDRENSSLMILLSYIILGHPDWNKQIIKIFNTCDPGNIKATKEKIDQLVLIGRLPITEKNIMVLEKRPDMRFRSIINEYSRDAGLTIVGFNQEHVSHDGTKFFEGYDNVGDILFVYSKSKKEIT